MIKNVQGHIFVFPFFSEQKIHQRGCPPESRLGRKNFTTPLTIYTSKVYQVYESAFIEISCRNSIATPNIKFDIHSVRGFISCL